MNMTNSQLDTYWAFLKTNPPFPQAGSGFTFDGIDYLTIAMDGDVFMWLRKGGSNWETIPSIRGNL